MAHSEIYEWRNHGLTGSPESVFYDKLIDLDALTAQDEELIYVLTADFLGIEALE